MELNNPILRIKNKGINAFQLIKNKGVKYTYNHWWFKTFYSSRGWLRELFLIKMQPWYTHYPSVLEIEVTTRCNLRCTMCEHTYWNEPAIEMSFEQFKYIVDQFPKLRWIGLTGIGSSFLNKDFLKMLAYVKSKNVFVEIYDTFYLLDEYIAKELIRIGVDRIIASIDAATKETYDSIRVGSNFERVNNNIRRLFNLRNDKNECYAVPEIGFHFIISKMNIHEVPKFVDHAYNLGATHGRSFIYYTKLLHSYPEIEDLVVDIPEDVRSETENKAKEKGINYSWNDNTCVIKPPINKCTFWIMPFIFATGHIIPCCATNEANKREFQKETSLGNIFEKPFKEIWRSDKYSDLRRTLKQCKVPITCTDCPIFDTGVKKS